MRLLRVEEVMLMLDELLLVISEVSQWRLHPPLPVFGIVVFMILGAMLASFLNVVVYRLPLMAHERFKRQIRTAQGFKDDLPRFDLAHPGSTCPNCGHAIRWYENIPLISWVALGGKCSHCTRPISCRYPGVEFIGAALGGVCAWALGDGALGVTALCTGLTILGIVLIRFDGHPVPGRMFQVLLAGLSLSFILSLA